MLRAAMERAGYHVLVAASGSEALDIARGHEGPIDLLITDMVMPKMNGRELARRLLEERPGVAVLFCSSGYPDTTFQVAAGEAPPAFLQSSAPIELTRRVREMLDSVKGGNGATSAA